MYQEHPTFIQPDNEEIKIWRYMDFTKFVSLIDSKSLYFTRTDRLEDPFEGSLPKANVAARLNIPDMFSGEVRTNLLKLKQQAAEINKQFPRYMAINCWHMNNHESAAMWQLYLKSNEGIAIQSTYTKLKTSIIDEKPVYIGKVKYLDYDNEFIETTDNILEPFVHKRMSFSHEQEIRALVWEPGDFSQETIEHGLKIQIDLRQLIEKIYVAPTSPAWFVDLVNSIVNRYSYNFEVVHSKLDESPVY